MSASSSDSRATEPVAVGWDAEYRNGRYDLDRPVGLVEDILCSARAADLPPGRGLYIGCGNGRNYLPLVAGGLDLIGLDVSGVALELLAERAPERAADLVHGDLSSLPPEAVFSIVIGIQVFQHGNRAEAHAHVAAAARRVLPGGLLCIRVNAAGTDVHHRHRVLERGADTGLTVKYLEGPKTGLPVHFFAAAELTQLLKRFEPVLDLRLSATERKSPREGRWLQWEGIWRRGIGHS
ncbi:MAG TPA: methyltransferase domain-containing protein [Solirubrobacterales bacterium]